MTGVEREDRERDYWDHHIPTLEEALGQVAQGPDPNTTHMLDFLGDIRGKKVLDFACGAGVTSAWLAQRGATVTGVDLSPASLRVAEALFGSLGLQGSFLLGDVGQLETPLDHAVGRYALHHVDVVSTLQQLRGHLGADAKGAFVETFELNPILRFARNRLTGRFGIARYGTDDEQPLHRKVLEGLTAAGFRWSLATAEYQFFRILDRQVLRYRLPRASRLFGAADDALGRVPALQAGSFHQVLCIEF